MKVCRIPAASEGLFPRPALLPLILTKRPDGNPSRRHNHPVASAHLQVNSGVGETTAAFGDDLHSRATYKNEGASGDVDEYKGQQIWQRTYLCFRGGLACCRASVRPIKVISMLALNDFI